jgi:hypothetical protein
MNKPAIWPQYYKVWSALEEGFNLQKLNWNSYDSNFTFIFQLR